MLETHLFKERQTVKLGLIKTVQDLFPGETLKTAYSIKDGVFCRLDKSALSEREVRKIGVCLREWVKNDEPIEFLCRKDGYYHYRMGETVVKVLYPADTHASRAEPFSVLPFFPGFIVDFAASGEEKNLLLPERLSSAYDKTQKWLSNIGIELVPDVNAYIESGRSLELISIAEALQEKEISDIADTILKERRSVRVVLITGPSSSGKTTFAQRLSAQLRVNGLRPIPLSLDNYFLNRNMTPRRKDGSYDFESLHALDLKLLQRQVTELIGGETVETPLFDFVTGTRMEKTRPLSMGPSEILLIEGIHALNPELLPAIGRYNLFKIYLGSLFELNVDLMNRVPTTEVRLLRRMVRSVRYRGTSPEETIRQWDAVRAGERKSIFRFAEESDVVFNSSLLYEMHALRPFAEDSLKQIPDDSPFRDTRDRLMNLLDFFQNMDCSKIPFNSILREFIGGSIYFDEE
ncbi:nucleoside kinase [Papillibacter cinnamivorans]|uniref:Uridine kinase n=1 Tax=Papillibacter cinnamivorans DSM 12816 TaxID=1122930 RepID=A0A1W2A3K5_9FIRM|nr:nucleoside kinase [Papillibacter cinnamivorans]SMC55329.1 uridine kinase [Papillibacter cinnamivorans DSM 12816]